MNDYTDNIIETGNIRILIVDDHDEVRQSLKELLSFTEDIEVIGEANNGQEGLEKAAELEPDIIIVDEIMPGLSGLEVSRKISESSLLCKVIMITDHDVFKLEAFECGVKAYLLKGVKLEILIDCIRRVYQGETIMIES
ncbi:MAG: response regulator transcription factor [Dehalococcoidales bacterium]|nr:MAG: response regulator transcription factor [Dehalococcoidales bacterium]